MINNYSRTTHVASMVQQHDGYLEIVRVIEISLEELNGHVVGGLMGNPIKLVDLNREMLESGSLSFHLLSGDNNVAKGEDIPVCSEITTKIQRNTVYLRPESCTPIDVTSGDHQDDHTHILLNHHPPEVINGVVHRRLSENKPIKEGTSLDIVGMDEVRITEIFSFEDNTGIISTFNP